MDGKISYANPSFIEEGANLCEETELTGKNKSVAFRKKGITKEKTEPAESQKLKESAASENVKKDTVMQKRVKECKSNVLKRKPTEDGVITERVLSEGEASSGFETISSIDSKVECFDDIRLSSSDSEHNYNVIVQIENDLAYQNIGNSKDTCYWKNGSNSPVRNNSHLERCLGEYTNPRHDDFRNHKESKLWQRETASAYNSYDRMDKWSREDEDPHLIRQKTSHDREWSKSSDHSVRSRESRSSDLSRRIRGSSDMSRRSKESRTYRSRSVRSRSRERQYRSMGRSNSHYKGRSTGCIRSGSFEKSESSKKRNSPNRRKRSSISKSPPASIWRRLGNGGNYDRIKKDTLIRSSNHVNAGQFRKKERTPFLVELEKKLSEAETQKQENVKNTELAEKDQTKTGNVKEVPSVLEPVISLNSDIEPSSSFTPNNMELYSVQYPSAPIIHPTMSVDNLPLVPGPTGLPVHITMTGEQIPHDMDGKRIPISPNGYYLPLDPTGRLFAHIVSPGNQAVPIHMTEDGVLRLPNSEPVPYGPSHNLPVNIDGNVIPIGPDSRPLHPCPNLPRKPPLNLIQMTQSNMVYEWQTAVQQATLKMSETCHPKDLKSQTSDITAPDVQHPNLLNLQPPVIDSELLLNSVQDNCTKVNKADLLSNYQRKVREKNEDALKRKEIEKNLGVSPSKGGVKRSIPKKLTQKKTLKDEDYSDYDMVLDSSDSDSISDFKSSLEATQDSSHLPGEIFRNSEDCQSIMSTICDKEKVVESKSEDFITKKIKQALKSLSESNFKPPALGRFIISDVSVHLAKETSPNASPLLRNRIKLPFLTPNASECHLRDEVTIIEKTEIPFKFLPEEKPLEKLEKPDRFSKSCYKSSNGTKFPVFTFDFAMQCDFTSEIIRNQSSKITEMEMEVVRLRNINANLLDGFRNIHEANKKKSEELRKALLEIEKRNNEILSLKCLISEKGK